MTTATFQESTVRAIRFSPTGQQLTTWLPEGEYNVQGVETIRVSEMGRAERSEAVRLSDANGSDWFVHPSQLSKGN